MAKKSVDKLEKVDQYLMERIKNDFPREEAYLMRRILQVTRAYAGKGVAEIIARNDVRTILADVSTIAGLNARLSVLAGYYGGSFYGAESNRKIQYNREFIKAKDDDPKKPVDYIRAVAEQEIAEFRDTEAAIRVRSEVVNSIMYRCKDIIDTLRECARGLINEMKSISGVAGTGMVMGED